MLIKNTRPDEVISTIPNVSVPVSLIYATERQLVLQGGRTSHD